MQPSEQAHAPRSYGPTAPSSLGSFPPIPPVTPTALPSASRPPASAATTPGPGPSSRRFHPRDESAPPRTSWAPDPIPPIEELRPQVARGLMRLSAPNLTTYIEHYHYYHFAGNCTVYQAPDSARARSVQIVADRPPQPVGQHQSSNPGFPAPSSHPPPNSPYPRDAARQNAYPDHQAHHNHLGIFQASSQSLPVILPLQAAAADIPPPPSQPRDAINSFSTPSQDLHSSSRDTAQVPQFRAQDTSNALPSMVTCERPVKRSRALSLPNAGVLRRVGVDSQSTTGLATPRSPLNSETQPLSSGVTTTVAGVSNSSTLPEARSPGRRKTMPSTLVRASNESDFMMNDWEHVVNMYLTGEGTRDGRPLRDITRGDGRRVEDRKLLEKRRTIGKTFEKLGRPLFEAAIGYKMEGKYRRKQKMYHVIARCRVVNGLRKAGEELPTDPANLTALIDRRMQEKAARNAVLNELPNPNGGNASFRRQPQHEGLPHTQPPHAQVAQSQTPRRAQSPHAQHDDKTGALLAAVAAQQQALSHPAGRSAPHTPRSEGERRSGAQNDGRGPETGVAQKRRHP